MFKFEYGSRHNLASEIPETEQSNDYSGLGPYEAQEMKRADYIDVKVRRNQKKERSNFKGYD